MIKDITIGQYIYKDSLVHRLDPRTKIIVSMLFIIGIFFIKDYYEYIYVLALTAISIYLSKIPVAKILKGLKPILPLIVLTIIMNAFFTSGEVIFQFLFFKLTIEGLLNPLKKLKVPAHEIAMMMSIALRFIPTLIDETDKIMKAQKARGADFESGNIIKKTKSLIPVLIPLFISAFTRADELAMAMEARGYRGDEGRTRFREQRLQLNDYLILLFFLVLTIFVGIRSVVF